MGSINKEGALFQGSAYKARVLGSSKEAFGRRRASRARDWGRVPAGGPLAVLIALREGDRAAGGGGEAMRAERGWEWLFQHLS